MDPVTFGQFAFNRGTGTLSRAGKHIPLGGRSSALLIALLDAHGAVVSKADLMERVWPGATVEEGNLTVQVAVLRKAMGQRADKSDWIVTAARVGYRLLTEDAEAPREATSPLPSLAVLPFHDVSGDAAQDYFADGIVDDLITALSRFRTFAVISRNSSFVYKGRGGCPRGRPRARRPLRARRQHPAVREPAAGDGPAGRGRDRRPPLGTELRRRP